jgi:hypothetical protein
MIQYIEENNFSVQGNTLFSWENKIRIRVFKIVPFQTNKVEKIQGELIHIFRHEENICHICGDEKTFYVLSDSANYSKTIWKWTGQEKKALITVAEVKDFFMNNKIFYSVIDGGNGDAILIDNGELITISTEEKEISNLKIYNSIIYANIDDRIGMIRDGRFEILFEGLKITNVGPRNDRHLIFDYHVSEHEIVVVFYSRIVCYNLKTKTFKISKINSTPTTYEEESYENKVYSYGNQKYCQRTFHCCENFLFILHDNLLTVCNIAKKERKTYTFPYTIQNYFSFDRNCFYFGYERFIHCFNFSPCDIFNSITMAEVNQKESKAHDFFHHETYHNVLLCEIFKYIEKYPIDINQHVEDCDVEDETCVEVNDDDFGYDY